MTTTRDTIIFSILGAVIYSVFDAGRCLASSSVQLSIFDHLLLVTFTGFSGILIGSLVGLFVMRLSFEKGLQRFSGFLFGVAALFWLDMSDRILSDPPPFVPAAISPWLGIPALIVVCVFVVYFILRWALTPKQQMSVVLLVCFSLAGTISSHHRFSKPKGTAVNGAPNILLVSLDTSRYDHFHANGNADILTPNFDELAKGGVLFSKAYAPTAVTGPSHFSLLTGQGPWSHGLLLNGRPLPPDSELFAERMNTLGYRTGGFVSAPVLDGDLGFSRGFDVYDDDFGWVIGLQHTIVGRLWSGLQRRKDPHHVLERRGQRTVDRAIGWVSAADSKPFFAWVHLFDPHGPYRPPPPWDTQYYLGDDPYDPAQVSMQDVEGVAAYLESDLDGVTDVLWPLSKYKGEISYADGQLGRLIQWLDDSNLRTNTMIIVTGDHGESFGEGGVWFNHGGQLNDAELHIPLVMNWPTILPEDVVVDEFVEISDILPTVFEAIVQSPPETNEGLSLLNSMYTGKHRQFARGICYDREANLAARAQDPGFLPTYRMVSLQVPYGAWTYHEATKELVAQSEGQIETPLADMYRSELLQLLEQNSVELQSINQDVDEQTRQQLEALGYVE